MPACSRACVFLLKLLGAASVGAVGCAPLLADEPAPALSPVDLIILAGQSNAVGFDAPPRDLPADEGDKEIMFWWRCGDPPPDEHDSTGGGKWTTLQPQPRSNPKTPRQGRQYGNFAQAEGGFGPEMGLARDLRALERKPLALVKVAFSGTGLRSDWNSADPGEGGACYRALLAEVKAARAAAKERGVTLRLRAFCWVQGESDANARDAPAYEANLIALVAALRKEWEAPDMAALLAVNTRFGGDKQPHMPAIVAAQQAAAAKTARCAYVDTASCEIANGAHFSGPGTLEVGRRFAAALPKLEAEANAPKP